LLQASERDTIAADPSEDECSPFDEALATPKGLIGRSSRRKRGGIVDAQSIRDTEPGRH